MEDKDKIIEELEKKLQQEIMVKKSEVLLNKELLEKIQVQNTHIRTLEEIAEKYLNEIGKLKVTLNKINEMTSDVNSK